MKSLWISSQYDSFPKMVDIDLEMLVSRPQFFYQKKTISQIQFFSMIPGSPLKRSSEYYDMVNALILDFDGGTKMNDFIEQFKKFEFYAWTTFTNSSKKEKFRVIMPLSTPISYKTVTSPTIKKVLQKFYAGVDPSSFVNYHKIPALNPNADTPYRHHINRGIPIDIKMETRDIYLAVKMDEDLERQMRPQTEYLTGDAEMTDDQRRAYKAKVDHNMQCKLSAIPTTSCGHRYTDLTSMTGSLLAAKYPDGEIIYDDQDIMGIITSHTNEKSIICMVRALCRRR